MILGYSIIGSKDMKHVKIPRPSFLLDSGTWKNFKLCLYISLYRLCDLERFHAQTSSLALGFEKFLSLP